MPRITLLYQYYEPDDVVSAQHFAGLARGLAGCGWEVEVIPCNRSCRDDHERFLREERIDGVAVRRIWRPRFFKRSGLKRILSAFWMITAWMGVALSGRFRASDVVIVGTDPVLAVVVVPFLKLLRPRLKAVHLVYDLYPEAAVADGLILERSVINRTLRRLLGWSYDHCDLIVDIGPCMRERLGLYGGGSRRKTIEPWALVEPKEMQPPERETRELLFGSAKIGLLYSGSLGRAHEYSRFVDLSRAMRGEDIAICFAARGPEASKLQAIAMSDPGSIRFVDFVPQSALQTHLSAADVHLASLRPGWAGAVIPSKFFGSLAVGRPVLFSGDADSSIARWIRELRVGWVLEESNMDDVVGELRWLIEDQERLMELKRHCFETYRRHFSYSIAIERWDEELRKLVA